MFKSEEKIFVSDGLSEYIKKLEYKDNQEIISLFDKSSGIFSLINEQCVLGNGSDSLLLNKIFTQHK